MENQSPVKMIFAGFWLGIGLVIPMLVVYMATTWATFSIPFMGMDEMTEDFTEDMMSEFDVTSQIAVVDYREVQNGSQLLIMGSIENKGPESAGSVQLEAELFDEAGVMVYECSEHVGSKLESGVKENFQIKCGCGDNPVPEHKTVTVRVVSASNF